LSVYTTEVRYICEYEAGLLESTGYNDVDLVVSKSWSKIFSNFPIFDENYREFLCQKILQHYYTREICAETVSLWKFWLNQKMREIMPYYNKLYLSEQLKFDPLHEIDFTRTISENSNANKSGTSNSDRTDSETKTENINGTSELTGSNTGTNKTDSSRTTNNKNDSTVTSVGTTTISATNNGQKLHSDTPQGTIDNIKTNGYLTDAEITTDTAQNTTSSDNSVTTAGTQSGTDVLSETGSEQISKTEKNTTANKTDTTGNTTGKSNNKFAEENQNVRDYVEHVTGKNSSSSYASLIQEYRETLLNIDMQIIFELSDLFMNIY
jgi:hypothetical protein